jgi:asparagine synthase (glutamine-hydrolysing)
MCGIACVFDLKVSSAELKPLILRMSNKLRHRGPDWSGIYCSEKAIMAHERLSIVDPQSGKQPLISDDGNIILAINGEIYNHKEIRKRYEGTYKFKTNKC